MLTINLISHELKNDIKLRHIYILLKKIYYVFFVAALIVSTSLVASKFIIRHNYDRIVAETSLVAVTNQDYNSKVRDINMKLNAVAQIQTEYTPWSRLLELVSNNTPQDITLRVLSVNKSSKKIKIAGYAATRSGLLDLKGFLEGEKVFTKLDFPIQNILQKDNITFDINAEIDIAALKESTLSLYGLE